MDVVFDKNEKWISKKGGATKYHYQKGKREVEVFVKRMPIEDSIPFKRVLNTLDIADNRHENIVRFYGFENDTPYRYIMTEWCPWSVEDLVSANGRIENGPSFDALPRKSILHQTSEAISFLHSKGIIHRNIKPSNLLIAEFVKEKFLIKLTDMQYCKNLSDGANNSGTRDAEWWAPEMLQTDKLLTKKTDVFLLGCIFFYVMSLGDDCARGDENFNNIVTKMIEKNPENRPTMEDIWRDYFNKNKECYPLYERGKPGLCVIFNRENFQKNAKRKGTEFDCNALSQTFSTLGFDVRIFEDSLADELETIVKETAEEFSGEYQSLVICILSHGHEGVVCGVDDVPKNINGLKSLLNSKDCPNLAGKPKIFIIQACQGHDLQYDPGDTQPHVPRNCTKIIAELKDLMANADQSFDREIVAGKIAELHDFVSSPLQQSYHNTSHSGGENPELDKNPKNKVHPRVLDMIEILSARPGFAARRRINDASYLIKPLCEKLLKCSENGQTNIYDTFHQVVEEVSLAGNHMDVDQSTYHPVESAGTFKKPVKRKHPATGKEIEVLKQYQKVTIYENCVLCTSLSKNIQFKQPETKGQIYLYDKETQNMKKIEDYLEYRQGSRKSTVQGEEASQ